MPPPLYEVDAQYEYLLCATIMTEFNFGHYCNTEVYTRGLFFSPGSTAVPF